MKVDFPERGWVDLYAETQEEADDIRVLRSRLAEFGRKYGIEFLPKITSGPFPEDVGVSIFVYPARH